MPMPKTPHMQQRRHAWLERKKLPKADNVLGRYNGVTAKSFQAYPSSRFLHKRGTVRYNQTTNQLSCRDMGVKPTYLILNLSPAYRKSCRGSILSQSLFLPPILGTESSLGLHPKLISPHPPCRSTRQVAPEENVPPSALNRCRTEATLDLEIDCLCRLDTSEQKCGSPRQLKERGLERKPAPHHLEINRPCLEINFSKMEGWKAERPLQPTVPHTEPSSSRAVRCMTIGKSNEGLERKVPSATRERGEKYSWFDSAIESDSSCSEQQVRPGMDHGALAADHRNADSNETDLATDPQGLCSLELEYYTTQRIIEWVQQVNRILFSPSCSTEAEEQPLTEQDTSIKIVYDGD